MFSAQMSWSINVSWSTSQPVIFISSFWTSVEKKCRCHWHHFCTMCPLSSKLSSHRFTQIRWFLGKFSIIFKMFLLKIIFASTENRNLFTSSNKITNDSLFAVKWSAVHLSPSTQRLELHLLVEKKACIDYQNHSGGANSTIWRCRENSKEFPTLQLIALENCVVEALRYHHTKTYYYQSIFELNLSLDPNKLYIYCFVCKIYYLHFCCF